MSTAVLEQVLRRLDDVASVTAALQSKLEQLEKSAVALGYAPLRGGGTTQPSSSSKRRVSFRTKSDPTPKSTRRTKASKRERPEPITTRASVPTDEEVGNRPSRYSPPPAPSTGMDASAMASADSTRESHAMASSSAALSEEERNHNSAYQAFLAAVAEDPEAVSAPCNEAMKSEAIRRSDLRCLDGDELVVLTASGWLVAMAGEPPVDTRSTVSEESWLLTCQLLYSDESVVQQQFDERYDDVLQSAKEKGFFDSENPKLISPNGMHEVYVNCFISLVHQMMSENAAMRYKDSEWRAAWGYLGAKVIELALERDLVVKVGSEGQEYLIFGLQGVTIGSACI